MRITLANYGVAAKWKFSRVQLDSLEARLRPVEQPDKRTPRGKSGLGAGHHGRVIDSLLRGNIRLGRQTQSSQYVKIHNSICPRKNGEE